MRRATLLLAILLALAPLAGCLDTDPAGDDPGEDSDDPIEDPGDGTDTRNETRLSWTQRPSVPSPRTEVATTILEGELYVIGGFEETNQPSTVVEVLDLAEGSWREAPSLPTPLHHARAVSLDGTVHVFGGYNAIPFQATPTHLTLEPGDQAWSNAEPLPVARGGHGAAVTNHSAYLVGGVGPDGELLAQVDVYHPDDGSYTQAPELPTPRDHLGVAASEAWIHAVGGREQSLDSNTGKHEVLVPGEEWIEASPMPTPRGGVEAASFDGSIVVAGGESEEDTFAEVEAWDPSRDDWTRLPDLPTPRHGLGVDGHGDELFTTAGGPEPGLTVSGAVEVLGPEAGEPGNDTDER